jgi:hypothetical protein
MGIGSHTTGYADRVDKTVTGMELGHLMDMQKLRVPVALYSILLILFLFVSRMAWLYFCARIASTHPEEAAEIIKASGRSFPFKGWRWPWDKGSS